MEQQTVKIKKERVIKIIHNKHPWIFSGAVSNAPASLQSGEVVPVSTDYGRVFALGAYNFSSDIRLRVVTWNPEELIDDSWFSARIERLAAIKEFQLGMQELPENRKNYRLVFSDSDRIPGLIIDRYGTAFVIQLHTLFAEKKRGLWVSTIKKLFNPSLIYERSDLEVRKKEGLKDAPTGILLGKMPEKFHIEEDIFKIFVDPAKGQKTGYFLDLRQARRRFGYWCETLKYKYVQNYFAYTGSFNLYAMAAGAEQIDHIDTSQEANGLAEENLKANGFRKKAKIITSDAFDALNKTRDESVDALVLDPPSFVKHKDKIQSALEGYERLNALAMKKIVQGGLLVSICCSSFISEEDFIRMLFKAAASVNCRLQVLEKLSQDIDHTCLLEFPEGRYLQAWFLYKL